MDPILVQRERVRRIANAAKRLGYVLFLSSMVLFFVALATDLPTALTSAAAVSLVAGCVVLAPAILLGYAVRGAEREEDERRPKAERARAVPPERSGRWRSRPRP